MSTPSSQDIEETFDRVGVDIWRYDGSDLAFDDMLQKVSRLQTQLIVQRRLHTTAKLLRQQLSDTDLPKQQAIRVKHFLKFVFEQTTRGNERHKRLRKLDCNALKFCGLSYKIKELIELPQMQFNFLVKNVEDFARRRNLAAYLYRDDIDKAVNSKLDPEDDGIFREFLKSHIDLRPAKRKRLNSPQPSLQQDNATVSPLEEQPEPEIGSIVERKRSRSEQNPELERDLAEPSAKNARLEQQCAIQKGDQYVTPDAQTDELDQQAYTTEGLTAYHNGISLNPGIKYYSFSFMSFQAVETMPEPFRTGLKTSKGWRQENMNRGLDITNGVTLFLPEKYYEDSFCLIRMGYESGFSTSNLLGLGDEMHQDHVVDRNAQ